MIKTHFGIIENIHENRDYSHFEPHKYNCIFIDDDLYINDWWDRLVLMKTYFHDLDHPALGLSRWGVTLIPPESLGTFQAIVLADERIKQDRHLVDLSIKIQDAIQRQKYMIHYGV